MRAWKCDRCGKLYAAPPSNDFHSVTVQTISYGTSCYYKGMDAGTQNADLCEDCAKDFIEWFNEPALAAITNEGE